MMVLNQVVMSNEVELPVRQAAVIYLKNMVSDTHSHQSLLDCKLSHLLVIVPLFTTIIVTAFPLE